MADIADFAFGISPSMPLSGTVNVEDEWVHVVGTLTSPTELYPYGQITQSGEVIAPGNQPGYTLWGRPSPLFFAMLPNPPYGAKIIFAQDDDAPNAMTEIDGSLGVFRDRSYELVGKFLESQVRSASVDSDGTPMLVNYPSAVAREYTYRIAASYGYHLDFTDPAHPVWVSTPVYVTRPPMAVDIVILSRGVSTFLGIASVFGPPPGLVIDFDIQWWNGPGYRCGDFTSVSVD